MSKNKTMVYNVFNAPPHQDTFDYSMPSQTQQHFANEVDINEIMRRAKTTGFVGDPLKPGTRQFQYGDFTQIKDYQSAQNAIIEAEESFYEIPAAIRAKFDNNPGKLLEFLADQKNDEEAIKLGLKAPKKVIDLKKEQGAPIEAIKEALTPKEPKKGVKSEGQNSDNT